MNGEELALLRSYLDRYRILREWVRMGPPRVRVGGAWRRVIEVRKLGYVLELLCNGHRRVRLPDDVDRSLRNEAEARFLLSLSKRIAWSERAAAAGFDWRSSRGGGIFQLRFRQGGRRFSVVAAGQSAPRAKTPALLVTVILWWGRLSEATSRLVLIPATWGDYLAELLQHLTIPLDCYSYTPNGSLRRIFPRDNRRGEAMSPYVIFPAVDCPSNTLSEKSLVHGELDLIFRAGRWELSYRGFPVLWSEGGRELLYDLRSPKPLRDERLWEQHLEEVRRCRSWPPPEAESFFYRWGSERWLESLVLRNRSLIDDRLVEFHCQVPTFVEGERKVLDLLALREDGQVVVIELKPAKDPGLLIQGLDYWQRVRFHLSRGDLQSAGYFKGKTLASREPLLALVSPLFEFHRIMPILRAHLRIPIHFECIGINSDWRGGLRVLRRALI